MLMYTKIWHTLRKSNKPRKTVAKIEMMDSICESSDANASGGVYCQSVLVYTVV